MTASQYPLLAEAGGEPSMFPPDVRDEGIAIFPRELAIAPMPGPPPGSMKLSVLFPAFSWPKELAAADAPKPLPSSMINEQ